MVERQIRARGIKDSRVLEAMLSVPREEFISADLRDRSYDDGPLPIGHDQTISQPYIVALMTACILPDPGTTATTVLEIGSGCGYQSAILARLFQSVLSFERVPELAAQSRQRLEALGIQNVTVHCGDGSRGMEGARFQAILAAAAFRQYPADLEQQVAEGGKMVLPAGGNMQYLYLVTRRDGKLERSRLTGVRFVPMIES